MGMIWGKYGYDMENGKSVANWWQNTGIDRVLKHKKNEIAVNNPNLTVETYLTYA